MQGARCTGCKVFYYCGRECQEEHWKETHRKHCKKMAQPRPILSKPTLFAKIPDSAHRRV